jgi:hypothetical protein
MEKCSARIITNERNSKTALGLNSGIHNRNPDLRPEAPTAQ